jgi:hypothetical protein
MILLPAIRTGYLKSFSLALSAEMALLSAFCWLLQLNKSFAAILSIAIVLASTSIVRPSLMLRPYRLWNAAARNFARCARLLLIVVCFYIVVLFAGRLGTSIKLARPNSDESLWVSKKFIEETLRHEFPATKEAIAYKDWVRSYFHWAKSSKQLWAIFLIPFLALLAAVEIYTDRPLPPGVYTLF